MSVRGTRLSAAVLAIGIAAAAIAVLRWELPREALPDVPLPAGSLVVERSESPGDDESCLLVVDTRELPEEVLDRWRPVLEEHGWERVETGAERIVFRRAGQRLLAAVFAIDEDPPRSRLRITVRPCRRP